MNNDIEQPKDYVVRVVRQREPSIGEFLWQKFIAGLVILAVALLLYAVFNAMLTHAAHADSAVAQYPGPVCQMQSNTTGFCPQ